MFNSQNFTKSFDYINKWQVYSINVLERSTSTIFKGPHLQREAGNSVCYSHTEFNVHGLLRIDGRPFFL